MRVGDPTGLNVLNTPAGTALSVHFDYFDTRTRNRWLTRSLPTGQGSADACTLTHAEGELGPSSVTYWLETEGLPSLTSSEDHVILPCHASPVGSPLSDLLVGDKSIGALMRNGATAALSKFNSFLGVRGTQTGIRQAASVDMSAFWVAGIANRNYGLRYLSSRERNATTRVHGSLFFPETPPRYQPGSLDLRGMTVYGSQLFMTSSWVAERNRNQDSPPTHNPWGGVVRIGEYGQLQREVTTKSELLRGFNGRRSYWTFMFEGPRSMWLIEDVGAYARASATSTDTFERAFLALDASSVGGGAATLSRPEGGEATFSRPVYHRTTVGSAVVNWAWSNAAVAWTEVSATKTFIPGGEAAYSLTGRQEPRAGGPPAWIAYTATRSRLWRVDPSTNTATAISIAPAGTIYRGVSLPPYLGATPSPAATPSRTKSRAATPSKTRKAKKA